MSIPNHVHGLNGYSNYSCKCDVCRTAHRLHMRDYRARLRAAGLPDGDPRHGSGNGYINYGCRCPACTAAHAQDQRRART